MFNSHHKKRFTKYLGGWVGDEQAQLIMQGYQEYETPVKHPNNARSSEGGLISNSSQRQNCAICLQSHLKKPSTLDCGHRFCRKCLEGWLETSERCPYCRNKSESFICDGNINRIEGVQAMSSIDSESFYSNQFSSVSSSSVSSESSSDFPFCYVCGDTNEPLLRCRTCRTLRWHHRCQPGLTLVGNCEFCIRFTS